MAAGTPPPAPGPAATPPPPGYQPTYQPAAAGMTDNVACALCYILGLFSGIFFLVVAPYNQNRAVRFHAFQSIFLNVGAIVLSIVLSVLFTMLHFVGAFFALFLGPLIWLAFVVLWLYMMIATYQGKTVVLPIIGPIAQQQA